MGHGFQVSTLYEFNPEKIMEYFEIMVGSERTFLIRILQKHDNHNNDDKSNKIFSNFSLLC